MKRKKISLVTITVFMTMVAMSLMTFFSLGGVREAVAQDMKIGFILKTMQEERYQTDKSLFIAKAEALGAQVRGCLLVHGRLGCDERAERIGRTTILVILNPAYTTKQLD